MGRKTSFERGQRRQETIRSGSPAAPNGFGGMLLECDPGAVPPFRIRHGENIRFVGGDIVCKDGQALFNDTALHNSAACITGIKDYQRKPHRLYATWVGCVGLSAVTGFSITWFDHEQDPRLQRGVYYELATAIAIGTFDGALLVGLGNSLRVLHIIVAPYGEESLGISGSSQDSPLATYTGFVIRTIQSFDGVAYLGLDAGAGASVVGSWDGLTMRTTDLTAINVPTKMGLWRDYLVLGFAAASNQIRLRDKNGVWTTVAPGAGTVASVDMISYRDKLYIADGGANVWVYDGSTLSVARNVVGAVINAVGVFNGFLFYGYQLASRAVIGWFDGSSWVDAHVDLTTQEPTARQPQAIDSYSNCLAVGVDGNVNDGFLFESPQTDTAGTYLIHNTTAGRTACGGIRDMVVL